MINSFHLDPLQILSNLSQLYFIICVIFQDCFEHQAYDPYACRCECKDKTAESKCRALNKTWDPARCICLCAAEVPCSFGLYYNHNKCRCERMPSSYLNYVPGRRANGNDARSTRSYYTTYPTTTTPTTTTTTTTTTTRASTTRYYPTTTSVRPYTSRRGKELNRKVILARTLI